MLSVWLCFCWGLFLCLLVPLHQTVGPPNVPLWPIVMCVVGFALESTLARQAHRAKFSPISPQLSPFFPIFCPHAGDPPEKAGVL